MKNKIKDAFDDKSSIVCWWCSWFWNYGKNKLTIGNPLDEKNHIGPLIDHDAVNTYLDAIEKAKSEGGNVLVDGGVLQGEGYESGCYVKPAIIEAENHYEIVQHEQQ